jgi:hypothetical protein
MLSLDTLDDVKRDFAKWRASRPNKGRIPNYLWDKVLAIIDFYPIGQVTKVLGLSGSQVSARRKQRDAINVSSSPPANPNFAELNISSAMPGVNSATSLHSKIEIRRADGAVLIIEQLSEQAMLKVLNQFTQVVQ